MEMLMNILSLLPGRITKRGVERGAVFRTITDEKGVTAIEYGLIAAGIAVAIITILPTLGGKLATTFGKVSNALN